MALHWKILLGLGLGLIYGIFAVYFQWFTFTQDWIKPFGTLFLNALKLIAVPLVLVTLITGVASLSDVSKLGKIGLQTVLLYIASTIIAITVGLLMVNLIQPWSGITTEFAEAILQKKSTPNIAAISQTNPGPLTFLEDMVPDNIFKASANNANILQVIFFAILFGVSLLAIPKKSSTVLLTFFNALSDVIIQMVNYIMKFAPIGTFALIAALLCDIISGSGLSITELLWLLGKYSLTVIGALSVLLILIYLTAVKFLAKQSPLKFLKAIRDAQLVAFSTSSSAATLPVSFKCAQDNLHIKPEISAFVLPLGATINMDGTSCYQAVAAVFIAQVLGYDLSIIQQLGIVLTATLASIGSAAVPGAGIVMLAIVLEQLKVPVEGIILIIGVDRLLDMCRTVINVTGDLTITSIIHQRAQAK